MKKWIIYLLGVITGIVLTFTVAYCIGRSNNSGVYGLEIFDKPGEYMPYTELNIFQVIESDCALATTRPGYDVVLIIPDGQQHFYDNQEITIKDNQRVQRVGTYKYNTKDGFEKTVPTIRIIDKVD